MRLLRVSAVVSIFLFLLLGADARVYGGGSLVPTYGTGKTYVRIYSDYFCPICMEAEPRIEQILSRLVRDNIITVTFIDVPVHAPTTLYATYFLYALPNARTFEQVLRTRAALFEAAKNNIVDKNKLEECLRRNGAVLKPVDIKPTLTIWNGYLREDGVGATPACVIDTGGKRSVYRRAADIVNALEALKQPRA